MSDVLGFEREGNAGARVKRLVVGLTAAVAIAALVSGCGASPSGSQFGSSGSGGLTVPKYIPSEYTQSTKLTHSWMQPDASAKTVVIAVILNANELSMNGFSHGFAEVDIPVGWQVTVNFTNKNNVLPGGLMVVAPSAVVSTKHVLPVFAGAAMKQPYQGIGLNQSASFTFSADKPGTYVLWSAPSGVSGTWLWFNVVKGSTTPVVKVKRASS